MNKNYIAILIALFLLCGSSLGAQVPIVHKSFDVPTTDVKQVSVDLKESTDIHRAFRTGFVKGLSGLCMDLTSDVAVRMPLALQGSEAVAYDKSFAVELWVKTKKGARQGTPIMSNKKVGDKNKSGWILGTSDNGAWYFNISDGNATYNYTPTGERQAINDGKWHHIAVSVDLAKKEIWYYLDGRNVGIYNAESLKGAVSELATIIGGSDENGEWSSRREWTAFNGMIDEVKIYNQPLSRDKVHESYLQYAAESSVSQQSAVITPQDLKVQVWNIWHGGHRFGEHVGLERVISVLKESQADVIGLIETYGSGEVIADSLGYYFYLISSNLSIMSRYPIDETIKVFQSFNSGGAMLDLGNGKKVAFFDIWLDYLPDTSLYTRGEISEAEFMKDENARRGREMKAILKAIESYSNNTDKVPVVMVGDFNSGSHLDWIESTKAIHNNKVIEWPVSKDMLGAQYRDSYRELNPSALTESGFTWSPLYSTSHPDPYRDRIDFIYYKGKSMQPYWSRVVDYHPILWPSDHASVVTHFHLNF